MSYRYEFDDTRDGDLRLRRTSYEILQDAYRGLRDELDAWNRRSLEPGGSTPPYEQEVGDLNSMLAWGDEQLAHAGASEVTVRGSLWNDNQSCTVVTVNRARPLPGVPGPNALATEQEDLEKQK